MHRHHLLLLIGLSLLYVSAAVISSSSSHHKREDVYDENPHPNPAVAWSDLKLTDWTPQRMMDWMRFKMSSFVPASMHASKLSALEIQKQNLMDKFRSYDWKRANPVSMLKSYWHTDSDLRRQINQIEHDGLRDYLNKEFQMLVDKYDTRGLLHDLKDSDDESSSFMSKISAGIMSVLMFPFSLIGSVLAFVGSTFLTIFEVMGLFLMYVAFFTPNVTEHSLLNSADGIFHHTSSDFFGMVDSKIRESRTRSTHSTALALLVGKVLIGAPLLLLGGPLFYSACVSWVLYRVLSTQHQYQKVIPGLFALFIGYFVTPSWIWSAVSWIVWRIGDYGMILVLYHAYSLILPLIASQRNKVQRQFAEEGAELSSQQKTTTPTDTGISSMSTSQKTQVQPQYEDMQLRQRSQQVPHKSDISTSSSVVGKGISNDIGSKDVLSDVVSSDVRPYAYGKEKRPAPVEIDTSSIVKHRGETTFPHSSTQQQTVGFGRGS